MAGIYIHVPFCAKRCIYCDFYSQTDRSYKKAYVQTIIRELEQRVNYLNNESIETIYFGGGTPSQLEAEDFKCIFDTIHKFYLNAKYQEITFEANPDDLTYDYLQSIRSLPFNRISLGVQSFQDKDLKMLNRRHDSQAAIDAIHRCKEAGFTNLSIDLIYGLPGQTAQAWEDNIEQALRLNVPHLSAYHLTYEEGTPIYKMLQSGTIQSVDEETSVHLYHLLISRLKKAGYEHYEISNFCLPNSYSRHNSSYWTGKKYLGIGPAAHSYDCASRQWNIASLAQYIDAIQHNKVCFEREILDERSQYNDYVMTRLRTSRGIQSNLLRQEFGDADCDYFMMKAKPYIESGKLIRDNETIRFSEDAFFTSDSILCDLIK